MSEDKIEKVCINCGQQKSISEFQFRRDVEDYRNECRQCARDRQRKWIEQNRTAVYLERKDYRKQHKSKLKEKAKIRYSNQSDERRAYLRYRNREYRENNPELIMLSSAKCRAKKNNFPFNIDKSDIIIPEFCPILGIKLVRNLGENGGKFDSPALDKIIPALGYVKGNVRVISQLANGMKRELTEELLVKLLRYVRGEI